MQGCLNRLKDQLEVSQDTQTLQKIKNYERFNGMTASITGPISLSTHLNAMQVIREELSEMLHSKYAYDC
jgi:putative copper export protein